MKAPSYTPYVSRVCRSAPFWRGGSPSRRRSQSGWRRAFGCLGLLSQSARSLGMRCVGCAACVSCLLCRFVFEEKCASSVALTPGSVLEVTLGGRNIHGAADTDNVAPVNGECTAFVGTNYTALAGRLQQLCGNTLPAISSDNLRPRGCCGCPSKTVY